MPHRKSSAHKKSSSHGRHQSPGRNAYGMHKGRPKLLTKHRDEPARSKRYEKDAEIHFGRHPVVHEGSADEVYFGMAKHTPGGLTKRNLKLNKSGHAVSIVKSEAIKKNPKMREQMARMKAQHRA